MKNRVEKQPTSNIVKHSSTGAAPRSTHSVSHLALIVISLVSFTAMALAVPAGAVSSTASVALNERSNGRSVTVNPRTRLNVTLHSTYWTLLNVKSTPHLRQIGTTTVVGVAPNGAGNCVPGEGCGTLSAHFVAVRAGTVRLLATRTTCGEALTCSPAQSVWTVVIHVR